MTQKQIKLLQELGNKNLSIEKKKMVPVGNTMGKLTEEGTKIVIKSRKPVVRRVTSKDFIDEIPFKKIPISSSHSNRDLAFGSCAPKKATSQSTTKKRRVVNNKVIMSIGSFQVPTHMVQKPACNVYNLGGPPV